MLFKDSFHKFAFKTPLQKVTENISNRKESTKFLFLEKEIVGD